MTLIGRAGVLSNINAACRALLYSPHCNVKLSCSSVCRRRFDGKRVLAQVVPNPSATAVLVQRAALDQSAEMLLERIPAGAGQLDGIANSHAAMLSGKLDDL